jgi:hypothetical protein
VATSRSLPRRLLPLAGGIVVLFGFWLLFYGRIWGSHRYIGWDLLHYNYPLDRYIYSHMSWSHGMPPYDPYTYNGIDFVGNIQAAHFYPPKLVMELILRGLGKQLTYPIYQTFLLAHVFVFSVGAFLLSRRIVRSWIVAMFAALTLAYAGYAQGQLEHLYFFGILAWAPLAYYGLSRGLTEKKESGYLIYAFASALMLLVGYPPLFAAMQLFIVVAAILVELLSRRGLARGQLARLGISWIVVALVTAPITLPFLSLNKTATPFIERPSLATETLWSAFLPDAVGSQSGTYNVAGTGVTNSYNFAGLMFYLLPLAAVYLLWRKDRVARRAAIALLAAAGLFWVFVYTPVLHSIGIPFFRPYVFGIFLLTVLTLFVVAAAARIARTGRVGVVAVLIIAAASLFLTYHYNRPGYFNTLPGPTPSGRTAIIGDAASSQVITADGALYSILVDQSVIRGKLDNWPRILGVRSLSGFDPTAQKPYMELVARRGLLDVPHSRTTLALNRPDFRWLADNGVKYFMTAKRWKWPKESGDPKSIWHGATYAIYELADPRPLFSSPDGCARIVSSSVSSDSVGVIAEVATEGCSIRTTTNYTKDWRAPAGVTLTPIPDALGFNIGNLHAGRQQIVLTYRNPLFARAKLLMLAGIILLVAWLVWIARAAGKRRQTQPEPKAPPALETEPEGRLAQEPT